MEHHQDEAAVHRDLPTTGQLKALFEQIDEGHVTRTRIGKFLLGAKTAQPLLKTYDVSVQYSGLRTMNQLVAQIGERRISSDEVWLDDRFPQIKDEIVENVSIALVNFPNRRVSTREVHSFIASQDWRAATAPELLALAAIRPTLPNGASRIAAIGQVWCNVVQSLESLVPLVRTQIKRELLVLQVDGGHDGQIKISCTEIGNVVHQTWTPLDCFAVVV